MDNSHVNSRISHDVSHRVCASSHEIQHMQDPIPPHQLISPEFAYDLLLSVAFGLVALTTLRFKVLCHTCVYWLQVPWLI